MFQTVACAMVFTFANTLHGSDIFEVDYVL